MKKKMLEFGIASLFVYSLVMGIMYFSQRGMMYFPPEVPADDMVRMLEYYHPVTVETADGLALTGYYAEPKAAGKPVILAFHGNASHPAWMWPYFSEMVSDGYGVLLAEYRGYGGNAGKPAEEGLFRDAEAYYTSPLLKEARKTHPMIIYGRSLGSAAAVDLASKHNGEIAGLVLETPFANTMDVVARTYPFIMFRDWLVLDQYRSDRKIGAVTAPKLFLLAGKDDVVGLKTGQKLFDLAPQPKERKLYPEAGHNDIEAFGPALDIFSFIKTLVP